MGLGNRFLDALPANVAQACIAGAALRTFAPDELVAHRGDPCANVHFPLEGAIAEIEQGLDGGTVEVTAIGYEGVSGVEALLDADTEQFLRIIEIPTRAFVVPVVALRALREQHEPLHRLIHRYAGARLRAAGITIGCNARHPVPARLARWLLRMHDRLPSGAFELTHETISLMLGVRRATVTRAISALAEHGAIQAARTSVRVADRPALEALACSCYPDSRDVFNELYGEGGRTTEI